MNATALQIVYPHTVRGLISKAHIDETAEAADTDTAIDYVSRILRDIRRNHPSGCFHVSAFGNYNLCISVESDGSVELLYQCLPSNSVITSKGAAHNQMRRVRQIIIEHFEGAQSFDNQLEAIYGTN